MKFVRDNSLSLFFGAIFLAALAGQSVAGHRVFNEEQLAHGAETITYARYLVSSHFGEAVLENWQSEWLQFALFTWATIWLVQKGSPESKELGEAGLDSDQKQRVKGYAPANAPRWAKAAGWRLRVYENSLVLFMLAIFTGSWFVQSVTGWTEYNDQQREHGESTVSWAGYLVRPDFWEKTLQNWQSEFLAIGTFAILAVYLRQRGSPESKPVGAPHHETSVSG